MTTPATIAPEKAFVSENGTAQSKPQQSSSQIDALLKANTTLAVWLIFLAIGGGLLALYYARIGYLPDVEWKAALIYLFIGSLVGGVIGLLLTMSLYLPGVIWSEIIIFERSLDFAYSVPGQEISGKEPVKELCIRSIILYLGLPFLSVLFLSHIALLIGKRSYWVIAVFLLGRTFLTMRRLFGRLLEKKEKELEEKGQEVDKSIASRQVFKYSSWFTLSVLLSQISMYVIYWLSGRPAQLSLVHNEQGLWSWYWKSDQLPVFVALTLICTAGVWISNHVVALRHRPYPRQAIVASLMAAGLLLFTADHFSSLSVKLMKSYGLGNQEVTLVLTEHGAGIVDKLGLCSANCPPKTLGGVKILSKVGDQYFLKVGDQYITLQKSDVDSIKR
jgi:hypothetical protein